MKQPFLRCGYAREADWPDSNCDFVYRKGVVIGSTVRGSGNTKVSLRLGRRHGNKILVMAMLRYRQGGMDGNGFCDRMCSMVQLTRLIPCQIDLPPWIPGTVPKSIPTRSSSLALPTLRPMFVGPGSKSTAYRRKILRFLACEILISTVIGSGLLMKTGICPASTWNTR